MSVTTSETAARDVATGMRGTSGRTGMSRSMTLGRAVAPWAALAVAFLQTAGCAGLPQVTYHLPGTVLVPHAAAGIEDRSAEYGAMFCSVLGHVGAEGGPWGACADYIETAGAADPDLPVLSTDYRILVIPGILGQCFSPKLQTLSDALAHLRETHGLTAEYFDVPALGSCEHNAGVIASYLRERLSTDARKYIVVGYSKGGCDAMTALVDFPEVREAVAALITVAAPVGGSRLPDVTPKYMLRSVDRLMKLGHCERGDGGGLESVRRPVRQAFLRDHPGPIVPTYSLVAVSEEESTTRLLKPFWRKLSRISLDEDAQVIASEGVPPGARFLGVLRADHWAIGMPFELSEDATTRKLFDQNHFPRIALLEAAIRIVVADLTAPSPRADSGRRPPAVAACARR